ncbi:MAG: AmmeMemoRadiSam system protein B [Lentisphaerae bacterium]|nr:MAG: AmmeMemoRadiSam system protein B [Lentisphaerota bacterium]
MVPKVRVPQHAGSFYPRTPETVSAMIQDLLPDNIQPVNNLRALIVPHAGWAYSGRTAARAYAQINPKNYRRIILLAPSHYVAINKLSLCPFDVLQTPIGDLTVDARLRDQLLKEGIASGSEAHALEHATEVHFPFLAWFCSDLPVLPILTGQMSQDDIARAARQLAPHWDQQTLVVVSSDFTHYGNHFAYLPFPVSEAPKKIRALDYQAIRHILKLDAKAFTAFCRETGATICGRVPIQILLQMTTNADTASLIAYTTSAEQTGDYSHSVSYAAISIHPAPYSPDSQQIMLRIARDAIRTVLLHKRVQIPQNLPAELQQVGACFVTLRIGERLRGCIGSIMAHRPLIDDLIGNAIQAAFHDPRFPPLSLDELEETNIHLSILSSPRPVTSPDEIILGYHGIILNHGPARAVFLPEVAIEQGWDLEETLQALSRKAGLPANAWEQATFEVFTTFSFGED